MVSFICNACGQSIRKNQVEKHYQTVCRNCEVLSCIDCGKDFHGDGYAGHTSCITEAEKYQGKLFKPKDKQNKGEQKQQQWIKQVQEASRAEDEDPQIKGPLRRLKQYSNIPRKKAKFQNFCKNSINVYDQALLERLWDVFSGGDKSTSEQNSYQSENGLEQNENGSNGTGVEPSETEKIESEKKRKKEKKNKKDMETQETLKTNNNKKIEHHELADKNKKSKKKRKRDDNDEENNVESSPCKKVKGSEPGDTTEDNNQDEKHTEKFKWSSIIKRVLREAPNNELSVKRLRKKVLTEFLSHGGSTKSYNNNELRALFEKKINKNPSVKVMKERAKLCT
ncbi:predicted protein [Nematostella vectensis]|uniref:Cell growth-regulating nucleolar protein n=1 Tax=Nematostella vectensis TaxID=45351 RepID=A7RIF9_NEMVE|nr:predicted protein [Nematostella vectensis]|eukprot:XP_001640761.1 predicted protein [Nematostella vectensis]